MTPKTKMMTPKDQNKALNKTDVSSSILVDSDLIGKELYYRSEITKCYTKFKVKNVVLVKDVISKSVCFSIDLISENNNKYTYEEDWIFTDVL